MSSPTFQVFAFGVLRVRLAGVAHDVRGRFVERARLVRVRQVRGALGDGVSELVRVDVEGAGEGDELRAVAVAVDHLRAVPEGVVVAHRVMCRRLDRGAGVVVRVAGVHVLVVVVHAAGVVVRGVEGDVADVGASFTPPQRAGKRRSVVRGVSLAALGVFVLRRGEQQIAVVARIGEDLVDLRPLRVDVLNARHPGQKGIALLVDDVRQRRSAQRMPVRGAGLRRRTRGGGDGIDGRIARKLRIVLRQMAVHPDDVAVGVGVNDVLGAEDREAFQRLLELDVRLAEVVALDAADIKVFRAAEVEQVLLRLQKILCRLFGGAGTEPAHVAGDERRTAVLILIVDFDLGVSRGVFSKRECCGQEEREREQFLHELVFPFSVSLQIVSGAVAVGAARATAKPITERIESKRFV
jgi:hypothetical protein